MADAVSQEIAQAEMWGAVATCARSHDWYVTELHRQRSNPRQQSGPDFTLIKGRTIIAVKVLVSGDLSVKQAKIRRLYEAAGVAYHVWHPTAEGWRAMLEVIAGVPK